LSQSGSSTKSRLFARPGALFVDDRSGRIELPEPPRFAMSYPESEAEPTVTPPPRSPLPPPEAEAVEPPNPEPDDEPVEGPARLFVGAPRAHSPRGAAAGITTDVDPAEVAPGAVDDWEQSLRWAGLDRAARTVVEDHAGRVERERMQRTRPVPEPQRWGARIGGLGGIEPRGGPAEPLPPSPPVPARATAHDEEAESPYLAQNPAEPARLRASVGRKAAAAAQPAGGVPAAAAPAPAPTPVARPAAPERSLAALREAALAAPSPASLPPAHEPPAAATPPPPRRTTPTPPADVRPPAAPSGGAAERLRQRGQALPASGLSEAWEPGVGEHPPPPTPLRAALAPPAPRAKASAPGRRDDAPFVPRSQRPARPQPPRVPAWAWASAGVGLVLIALAFVGWRIQEQLGEGAPAAPENPGVDTIPVVAAPVVETGDAPTPPPPPIEAAPAPPLPAPPSPATPVAAPDDPAVGAAPAAPVPPAVAADVKPPEPAPSASPSPEPAPAPEIPTGVLRLKADARARVFIDGTAVGTISETTDFTLPGGEHKVRVTSLATGRAQTMLVRVDPGRSTLVEFQVK
jgi:hypothetical protein